MFLLVFLLFVRCPLLLFELLLLAVLVFVLLYSKFVVRLCLLLLLLLKQCLFACLCLSVLRVRPKEHELLFLVVVARVFARLFESTHTLSTHNEQATTSQQKHNKHKTRHIKIQIQNTEHKAKGKSIHHRVDH